MNWLFEDAFVPLIVGVVVTLATAYFWLQTGYRVLLQSALVSLLLTIAIVVVERLVETDREQIERTLQAIAQDVERNDLEAVLGWVHSSATETRRRAEADFPRYEFHHVSVKRNLEIAVLQDEPPREVAANFNVVVVVSDRGGLFQQTRAPVFVEVEFKREEDRWKVLSYTYSPAQEGLLRSRPPPQGLDRDQHGKQEMRKMLLSE